MSDLTSAAEDLARLFNLWQPAFRPQFLTESDPPILALARHVVSLGDEPYENKAVRTVEPKPLTTDRGSAAALAGELSCEVERACRFLSTFMHTVRSTDPQQLVAEMAAVQADAGRVGPWVMDWILTAGAIGGRPRLLGNWLECFGTPVQVASFAERARVIEDHNARLIALVSDRSEWPGARNWIRDLRPISEYLSMLSRSIVQRDGGPGAEMPQERWRKIEDLRVMHPELLRLGSVANRVLAKLLAEPGAHSVTELAGSSGGNVRDRAAEAVEQLERLGLAQRSGRRWERGDAARAAR